MGAARLGGMAPETLVTTATPRARLGAVAAETMVATTQPRARPGQLVAEVLVESNAAAPAAPFIGWGIQI